MSLFRVKSTLFLTISICCIITQISGARSDNSLSTIDRNLFADSIFQKLAAGKEENVIFSPASIQTALTLLYFGAGGETAQELRNVLKLGNADSEIIAKNFANFVGDSFKKGSNDDNGAQLRMVNRIYVAENARLKSNFNEITTRAFQSKAEQVNFADSANTVRKINKFVEKQTQNKIKDLLSEDSVDEDTSVVLINAIYFKGKWEVPFKASATYKSDFFFGKNQVQVDTMHMTETVRYGEFSDLDAKVLELVYAHSNLSMLFLLPNNVDNLKNLENKLEEKSLNEIASNLKIERVDIAIPKFCIEYEIDLNTPLKELGLKTVFQEGVADLSGLLENPNGEYVSRVKHKAFIEVGEDATEAAAATYIEVVDLSGIDYSESSDPKSFIANHPFVFAIRDSEAVYFIGHLLKFNE